MHFHKPFYAPNADVGILGEFRTSILREMVKFRDYSPLSSQFYRPMCVSDNDSLDLTLVHNGKDFAMKIYSSIQISAISTVWN